MGKIKNRIILPLIAACFTSAALAFTGLSVSAVADAAGESALNERLIVKYSLDETSTGNGAKLTAQKWDKTTNSFIVDSDAEATVQNSVSGAHTGAVARVEGIENFSALSFTGKAHARASFQLPSDATGMTVTMWVKNLTTYWGSLVEFWDGTNGGRLGKGTMQGNGGRANEADPWKGNCSAHANATFAPGGGWDSFVVTHNNTNNDNGGAAVDNMQSDTWYHVTYCITATEMRAYRDGELKQTFNNSTSKTILDSVMKAAKSSKGKIGIRLGHDSTDTRADIVDDFRVYNGAMTAQEVASLYGEYKSTYDSVADIVATRLPEYYEIEGLGYPEEMLFDGATSVSDGEGGTKTGVTGRGVSYTYTPAAGIATPEKDAAGIRVVLGKNGVEHGVTVKFRRKLSIVRAESLGYKIGGGDAVNVPVPEAFGEDIIIKVARGTDLSNVTAGDIVVKKFDGDSDASHYTSSFTYKAASRTATVRCSYNGFHGFDSVYTLRFVEKSDKTFASATITGGAETVRLAKADFTDNSAEILVGNLADFSLTLSLSLEEGAELQGGGNTKTFAAGDLSGGKLAFTVINENGDPVVYYLVPKLLSSDATLSALSAGSYGITDFAANKFDYAVTVNKGEGIDVFNAVAFTESDAKASAEKFYNKTNNTIVVAVTAANGSVQHYTIRITERDTDATLGEIKVGGKPLADFSPEKTDYTAKYAGAAPTVAVTTTSATATASVGEPNADGKVTIAVTAESGATKTYTVKLVQMSGDKSLKKLTLNGTQITFENDTAEYRAPLGTRINGIVVIAETAEGASASHKIKAEENKIVVTVTAEDGTEAVYTVAVNIQPFTPTEDGETVDNSPVTGGCASSVSGAALAATIALTAGVCLFVKKTRKGR